MEEEIQIEDGLTLIRFQNDSPESFSAQHEIGAGLIQFHFGLKGNAFILSSQDHCTLELKEEKSLILCNLQQQSLLKLKLSPNSWVISVIVSINKFHSLFSVQADYISILSPDRKKKKYYTEGNISPSMAVVLSQLFHYSLHPSLKNLYYKGKGYELLSLYFNKMEDPNAVQCPFLIDEDNVLKIKKAREILIANMAEPPRLQQLADEIGLNMKKLKIGFKQIYGDTVYGFLFDYKMDFALKLLDSGSYNVNEVGLKIGYSTGSHFIAGFKKKFSTTPKRYLMSINTHHKNSIAFID
ncbi:helix-turn-helix domain-containing protein [Flavobacterium quisquiliarum]|uniref:AraC family transcriptional regulator n=1 Tax=Flavobacterium quisquiliarum TaxID=1834436 RepID=UPI001C575270|nr:AraC family transcriptional regulator [Flavobacterium quisquiliarum]MBW1655207.1 helix-turn-helix domain-containing protein [Flavobacterium quisquiliarum]